MPNRIIRPTAEDTTRERILKAAMLRFSTHSYEETGLRDIAADVGVDMAYVHRSFGSKEKLFREAVDAIVRPEMWFVGEPGELHQSLSDEVLSEKGVDEIRPFDIIVRSFFQSGSLAVLRELLDEGFVKPFASKCPLISEQRASVIAAFLAGVGILRDVVGAPALQKNRNDRELGLLISDVIALLMNDDMECQTTTVDVPVPREAQ